LTCERSAEIYFLFENADPSAVGDQSCPIVEKIGEFSDALIGPRGRPIDFDGALHIESFMRALVDSGNPWIAGQPARFNSATLPSCPFRCPLNLPGERLPPFLANAILDRT
jgi:hypothetical protein